MQTLSKALNILNIKYELLAGAQTAGAAECPCA